MNFRNLIVLLAALPFLFSCGISRRISATRFETPESTGKLFAGRVDGKLHGANEADVVKNFNYDPPVTDSPSIHSYAPFDAAVMVGIWDRLDIGIRDVLRTPALLTVKFQVLGDGEETAEKGNFPVAVSFGAGYQDDNYEAKSEIFVHSGQVNASAKTGVFDLALLMGYRFHDEYLVYMAPFYSRTQVEGEVKFASGKSFPFSQQGNVRGINLGFQWDRDILFAMFETSFNRIYWDYSPSIYNFRMGVAMGIRW